MAGSQRLKRMADSVQRELSELIRQELKDPRLGGLVTISAVKVSADMGYAEVYVTVMGRELGDEQSEVANKETLDVLNNNFEGNIIGSYTTKITYKGSR